MNKEVKELIEQLEEYASGGVSGLYPFEESVKALLEYINQLEKGSYIEEGINGQWTNWKFEAENYKKVCDDLYKKVNQLETNREELKKWLEEEKNKHYDRKWLSDDELCYRLEDNSAKTIIAVQTKIDELERGKE